MEATNEIGIDVVLMLAGVAAKTDPTMVVWKNKEEKISFGRFMEYALTETVTGEDVLVAILFYIVR